MEVFDLKDNEFIPLCDLLKIMRIFASGGEAKIAISEGMIEVDGQIELRKRCKIRKGQKVSFQSTTISVE